MPLESMSRLSQPGLRYLRSIVTRLMTMSVVGRSRSVVGVLPIFRTTSIPSITSPKTEWRSSRCGVGASVMKNWPPLVFGPRLAIARMAALMRRSRAQRDEELAAVGVRAAVGHRQDAGLVVPQLRMKLVAERVSRSADPL